VRFACIFNGHKSFFKVIEHERPGDQTGLVAVLLMHEKAWNVLYWILGSTIYHKYFADNLNVAMVPQLALNSV